MPSNSIFTKNRRLRIPDSQIVDIGHGTQTVVFLHGLFGNPTHWQTVMNGLGTDFRLIAPQLPVDRQPGRNKNSIKSIDELTDCVAEMVDRLELEQFVLCGNSLGGLIALDYSLRHPNFVSGLVLAGSAGLYERNLTGGMRPRPSRKFVRQVASDIIYNQALVTESLIDEWFEGIKDRNYVRFILQVSRATRDRNLQHELCDLRQPTLIVWGRNDIITPSSVAEDFSRLIPNAELQFIEECGHAPNLERPEVFSRLLKDFLPGCFTAETAAASP